MPSIFQIAAQRKFRFSSPSGALTTEQLFDLPLTSTTGKANLNDIAVGLADQIDKIGVRSFVDTATTNPAKTEATIKLDVVKAVIEVKQAENAAVAAKAEKRRKRDVLLDAIAAADARELGAKSGDELRKQLAELDD